MIKQFVDWLKREPSRWEIIYTQNVLRTSDKAIVAVNIISRDQYGNIKTDKVRI